MPSKPTVLFLCIHNAGRSQIAAAYLTHFTNNTIQVYSAGSAPAPSINPIVMQAMLEEGIDLSNQKPKALARETVEECDVVVTMGCGDACPYFPGKRYVDWRVGDPAGQGIEVVRGVRDEIRGRVEGLIDEMRVS